MVIHSGLYISVSSSIYHSLLDLLFISPVLVLTLTHEPWYAAFKMCWYKATSRKGCHFIDQTFLANKCSLAMSTFMQVLACSTIQYCDELFNGVEIMCGWLFRERVHFYKVPSYSWKAYPPFSTTKEKGCFIATFEWMKKARQFDFTPRIAGEFCQPRSSSTHNCCTTGMTRSTTSVSTAQLLIFLLCLLAASVARANILVSASLCKQGANEGISQAGHI